MRQFFFRKRITHIILLIIGFTCVLNTSYYVRYYNTYSANQTSFWDTYSFQQKYMKYLERLTLYLHYTELGYKINISELHNISDIYGDIENDEYNPQRNSIKISGDAKIQEEYELYHYYLNTQATNFLYYVENTSTGEITYSPMLEQYYPDGHIKEFIRSIESQSCYFVLNSSTGKYYTNVSQNYEIFSKYNISWMVDTLSNFDTYTTNNSAKKNNYIIYTAIVNECPEKEDTFHELYQQYSCISKQFYTSKKFLPVCLLLFILFFLYICIKTGDPNMTNMKRKRMILENGIALNAYDQIKTELALLISLCIIGVEFFLVETIYTAISHFKDIEEAYTLFLLYCIIAPNIMQIILSCIRRIKADNFFRNSICFSLYTSFHQATLKIRENRSVSIKTCTFLLSFLILQMIGAIFYNCTPFKAFGFFILFLSYIHLAINIYRFSVSLTILLKETNQLSEGNITNKIPVSDLTPPMDQLGTYINNITDGLSIAVDEKIRSERFKTELITNVSHDIKTPLTSIINYIDLLKKEELNNPKAEEYLSILTTKSWRLKTLIEDLVEASKASSGAIKLHPMRLSLGDLIIQISGEFDDRFNEKNLELIFNFPESPILIFADGRSTYRIIENLFSNVYKYAMPGTRVYANITTDDNYGIFMLKNISREKLNISAEELMQRFVRGDISRNTEGSGLGLSIARSLTTLQHGKLDLSVDGDLYKAIVSLPLVLSREDSSVAATIDPNSESN